MSLVRYGLNYCLKVFNSSLIDTGTYTVKDANGDSTFQLRPLEWILLPAVGVIDIETSDTISVIKTPINTKNTGQNFNLGSDHSEFMICETRFAFKNDDGSSLEILDREDEVIYSNGMEQVGTAVTSPFCPVAANLSSQTSVGLYLGYVGAFDDLKYKSTFIRCQHTIDPSNIISSNISNHIRVTNSSNYGKIYSSVIFSLSASTFSRVGVSILYRIEKRIS